MCRFSAFKTFFSFYGVISGDYTAVINPILRNEKQLVIIIIIINISRYSVDISVSGL